MMLDTDAKYIGEATGAAPTGAGVVSIVGITGNWAGSGVFCCSPAFASAIRSKMLGSVADPEKPAIDEEVLDVVAEITNMMIGNVKNAVEIETGPLAISVPTVIHGLNFHFRSLAGLRGTAALFEAGGERFEIRVSLAPVHESAPRARVPIFGLAHV
jgi:chemotaxis protein CheX